MFGMMGLTPDWNEVLDDEENTTMSTDDIIEQDDIVEVATCELKPTLCTSTRYEALASLRVLGTTISDERTLYLLLVTDVDAAKIISNVVVDKRHMLEYDVEDRFYGDNAIVVSELHIRRIVLKQNGRFCVRCKEYNRHVRIPKSEAYVCQACVLNPYR
jgi:hypothetical protein